MPLPDYLGLAQRGRQFSQQNTLARLGIGEEQGRLQRAETVRNTLGQLPNIAPEDRRQYLTGLAAQGDAGQRAAANVQNMYSSFSKEDQARELKKAMDVGRSLKVVQGNPERYAAVREEIARIAPKAAEALPKEWNDRTSAIVDAYISRVDELGGGAGIDVGTYNPRDYTAPSFAEFTKTGDPGVLKRYAPRKNVEIGGVPHVFDPSVGDYVPAKVGGKEVTSEEVGASEAEIKSQVTRATEQVKTEIADKVSQQGNLGKLEDADRIYKILSEGDLGKIYGRGESLYPELLRSQEGIDMMANKQQLVSMLSLAARGELKGQGQISDSEQKILREAVSILENQNISPDLAKSAIDSAMNVLYRNAGKEFKGSRETITVQTPDGQNFTFPDQQSADKFREAAGL